MISIGIDLIDFEKILEGHVIWASKKFLTILFAKRQFWSRASLDVFFQSIRVDFATNYGRQDLNCRVASRFPVASASIDARLLSIGACPLGIVFCFRSIGDGRSGVVGECAPGVGLWPIFVAAGDDRGTENSQYH
ncbi:hypothetical protein [Phyllobacterium zundukense]|uniref:Uncharacterized protein n=1 Tax=Phyllobacterium zundukense TaxID=1867719 RepID=A0ACD4D1W1_9HYPH|nr:hypothetical protein [Phyllobacterium zundukense]UXN59902.1 hypothetical protein N8E88_25640 [Phyllobacterium zundukense]